MIGPPPSFYDPNQAVIPQGLDYEQWIMENYPATAAQSQQQQQQQQQPQQPQQQPQQQFAFAQGGISGSVPASFSQQPQLHHVPPAPAHNQYNFVQEYSADAGPSYDSHHVPTSIDRPQRGLPSARISGSRRGVYPNAPQVRVPSSGSFPHQPQPSPSHPYPLQSPSGAPDSYFYGQQQPQPGQPQQHSSYNFVDYQHPDHPQQPFGTTPAEYTPMSDMATLPSSVSTPSVGGTDEAQAHAYPPVSQQHALHPHASSSSRPAARAPRGRSSRGGKRARVEDSQDGESDTQSDDDGPLTAGGFTTVSVPPPQGQGAMPTRL